MKQRFETLFKLENNLYTKGSPIIISAGVLMKDSITDKVIVQMKFQSISEKTIIALKISFNAFDISGKFITAVEDYHYLELNAKNGDYFGSDKAIILADNITRAIEIENIVVVFEEEQQYLSGEELQPLTPQEKLESFFSEEYAEQYRRDIHPLSEYVPKDFGELWLCSCQKPNNTHCCTNCGAAKETVFASMNCELLEEHLKEYYIQKEQREEVKRAKIQQQKIAEQAQQEKRKKTYQKYTRIAIAAVVAVLSLNLLFDYISTKLIINEFEAYIENEQFEQAFDVINRSDLSWEKKDVYREIVIPLMQEQHDEIRDESSRLAAKLGDIAIYVSEHEIYSESNDEKVSLYKTSGNCKLKARRTAYANGYLIFIESENWFTTNPYKSGTDFTINYLNLETCEVERLAYSDTYSDIIKLKNGDIFVCYHFLRPEDGFLFDPYTLSEYEGEDVLWESWEEDSIYIN